MGGINTRVNHVCAGAGAGAVVVDVGRRTLGLVRDSAEAPGRASLRNIRVDAKDGLFFNILNLFVSMSTMGRRILGLSLEVRPLPRAEPEALPEGQPQSCQQSP